MDNTISDIYTRQQDLLQKDFKDESVLVIGLGGIGSWVALNLALLGVGTLVLIDPDTIEASNLNRTLFKLSDIGRKKTEAIKYLISERRQDTIILTIDDYFSPDMLDKYSVDYIFDCTDNLNTRDKLKDLNFQGNYVKCGYDGYSATISINDFESGSWGEGGSYTTVPSFFGTPQVISALVITEMLINVQIETRTINFEIDKVLGEISGKGITENAEN
ncbi:MAG: ThiF family adenylyltransferase [Ignavibacteria bacterium]|nr:ThiF family adenylyltransferase [Ignavibacteria bacterium]